MDKRRNSSERSSTCCPSCSMETRTSGMTFSQHGGDACYRHVWRRAAATVGRAHWEPAGARNPKAAGIHPENLRAHRSCARAREEPPVNAAASTEVPVRPPCK
ncbi:conserved hypothetical protein [Trichinella spiralis]|uniref:hypothetical protein n=1 Tax=Trichinella spiralis TaxID=6334 RepID=UPI0001EFDC91|nr:conserved hypothetical protein [Trichinella spiralis]XP_003370476.1 conserved hypothetical protein [Trichinella spiralis]